MEDSPHTHDTDVDGPDPDPLSSSEYTTPMMGLCKDQAANQSRFRDENIRDVYGRITNLSGLQGSDSTHPYCIKPPTLQTEIEEDGISRYRWLYNMKSVQIPPRDFLSLLKHRFRFRVTAAKVGGTTLSEDTIGLVIKGSIILMAMVEIEWADASDWKLLDKRLACKDPSVVYRNLRSQLDGEDDTQMLEQPWRSALFRYC